ncbi:MAG TPA: alpha/beta hydrolase [Candidatus Sulfotelmatobacter sp.]|nr:alpha/beta hydrolase [Candidatus Sulfotelmatobacter sp.]
MGLDWRIRALQWFAQRRGRAFRPDLTVAQLRAGYADMNRQLGLRERTPVTQRDLTIPTDEGGIAARLYRVAAGTGPAPLLVFFHGGGFVIGDVPSYDHLARFFAIRSECAVLSVEYRLSPEYHFPRGHEDAFAAYRWACANAAALGIDPRRIAVGGDSAGGTLAEVVGAFAGERGLPAPAFQLLMYPLTDATGSCPSRAPGYFPAGLPFTEQTIAWFHRYNATTPEEERSPLLAPLLLPPASIAASPPTYLLAAGYDPLVDEGRAYAEKLRAAGVPVTYDLRPTLTHGFVNFAGAVPAARRALLSAAMALRAALRGRAEAA